MTSPFPLLSLPNELLITTANHLPALHDVHSLLLTNRRLSSLLPPVLHSHAATTDYALPALYWAIATNNHTMARHLLHVSRPALLIRTSTTILHHTPNPCPSSTLSKILADRKRVTIHHSTTLSTPLHFAAEHNLPSLLSALLSLPLATDLDAKDANGRTPLHLSFVSPSRPPAACARALIAAGSSTRVRDHEGRSPLHYAVTSVAVGELRSLLDCGAGMDVDATDDAGRTPLHVAALAGKAGAVEVLLKRGANVAVRDGRGMTALHVVARARHYDAGGEGLRGKYGSVAWLLVVGGADGTIRDMGGNRVGDLVVRGRRGSVRV